MATLPQSRGAGETLALVRPAPACPHCRTPLKPWPVAMEPPPAHLFWCPGCLRPVCLEPLAVQHHILNDYERLLEGEPVER